MRLFGKSASSSSAKYKEFPPLQNEWYWRISSVSVTTKFPSTLCFLAYTQRRLAGMIFQKMERTKTKLRGKTIMQPFIPTVAFNCKIETIQKISTEELILDYDIRTEMLCVVIQLGVPDHRYKLYKDAIASLFVFYSLQEYNFL